MEVSQFISTGMVSLSGVAVSAYVSYKISKQQIKQKYNENLYNKRLDRYPDLYEICSSFAKSIKYDEVTELRLLEIRNKLDDWDSKFAILLSPVSTNAIFELRLYLRGVTTTKMMEDINIPINIIARLENALKTELGIFGFENFHQPSEVIDVFDALPENLKKKLILNRVS